MTPPASDRSSTQEWLVPEPVDSARTDEIPSPQPPPRLPATDTFRVTRGTSGADDSSAAAAARAAHRADLRAGEAELQASRAKAEARRAANAVGATREEMAPLRDAALAAAGQASAAASIAERAGEAAAGAQVAAAHSAEMAELAAERVEEALLRLDMELERMPVGVTTAPEPMRITASVPPSPPAPVPDELLAGFNARADRVEACLRALERGFSPARLSPTGDAAP
jgi:hypothetical protein